MTPAALPRYEREAVGRDSFGSCGIGELRSADKREVLDASLCPADEAPGELGRTSRSSCDTSGGKHGCLLDCDRSRRDLGRYRSLLPLVGHLATGHEYRLVNRHVPDGVPDPAVPEQGYARHAFEVERDQHLYRTIEQRDRQRGGSLGNRAAEHQGAISKGGRPDHRRAGVARDRLNERSARLQAGFRGLAISSLAPRPALYICMMLEYRAADSWRERDPRPRYHPAPSHASRYLGAHRRQRHRFLLRADPRARGPRASLLPLRDRAGPLQPSRLRPE